MDNLELSLSGTGTRETETVHKSDNHRELEKVFYMHRIVVQYLYSKKIDCKRYHIAGSQVMRHCTFCNNFFK